MSSTEASEGARHHLASKTAIRLAVVTETWPPEVNGVANTIFQLVSGLLEQGDYHVSLVRPRQKVEQPTLKHPAFEEITLKSITLPFYEEVHLGLPQYFTLKKHWSRNCPDIVQIVTEGPLGYAAVKAARALNIPVFSDFHTRFDEYSKYYRVGGLLRVIKYYLRHFHNQTAMTLVPTAELNNVLQQEGYQHLKVLARGVDTKRFNPAQRSHSLRHKLNISDNQLLVMLVARLAPEKNAGFAFSVFRQIQRAVPDARFVLVGDGPERARLQAKHPDCIFTGMQCGEELATYYASADLFLYPSSSETFGLVVLEALASGLPVIAYDYAATALHIKNRENGLAIPLNDEAAFCREAVHLATDRQLRQKLAVEARKTASTLDWQCIVTCFDQIIRDILAESRHKNPVQVHYA
ncbi:MAG: glycosyltransferase family 4 protein [Thiolinea sp.]